MFSMFSMLKKLGKRWVVFVGLTVGILLSLFYESSPAIHGSVFDSASGNPLSGVVVAAVWRYESGGFSRRALSPFVVREAITDDKGYFYLSGWKSFHSKNVFRKMAEHEPKLLILKEGYKPFVFEAGTRIGFRDKRNGVVSLSPLKFEGEFENTYLEFEKLSRIHYLANDICLPLSVPGLVRMLEVVFSESEFSHAVELHGTEAKKAQLTNIVRFVCSTNACERAGSDENVTQICDL